MIICICSSYFSNQHTSSNAWSSIGDGEIRSLRLFDIVSHPQEASAGKHSVLFISAIMYESLRSIPWTLERESDFIQSPERERDFIQVYMVSCAGLSQFSERKVLGGGRLFCCSHYHEFFSFSVIASSVVGVL